MYDYTIVGAGLFGSIFAYEASRRGKRVLVIDKKCRIGGMCACDEIDNIIVHRYGPHIFHTNKPEIWQYVSQFVEFNHFINSPLAYYKGELYNLPFNMNTFYKLWGTIAPQDAFRIIEQQRSSISGTPRNLEEQAISLVGTELYEKLVKGYTEKQWGRNCVDLPAYIIRRIPIRYTYDNNYYNDIYQGIPKEGYNALFKKLLHNVNVNLNTDFFANRSKYLENTKKLVFSGRIDQFFDYKFGMLEYRSLRFENETYDIPNFQGNAVVNYTDVSVPYTRIVEHKHFNFGNQDKTIITKEYPLTWDESTEPYYPVNDRKNQSIFSQYEELKIESKNIIFGGRLADYMYYDMQQVVENALNTVKKEFEFSGE